MPSSVDLKLYAAVSAMEAKVKRDDCVAHCTELGGMEPQQEVADSSIADQSPLAPQVGTYEHDAKRSLWERLQLSLSPDQRHQESADIQSSGLLTSTPSPNAAHATAVALVGEISNGVGELPHNGVFDCALEVASSFGAFSDAASLFGDFSDDVMDDPAAIASESQSSQSVGAKVLAAIADVKSGVTNSKLLTVVPNLSQQQFESSATANMPEIASVDDVPGAVTRMKCAKPNHDAILEPSTLASNDDTKTYVDCNDPLSLVATMFTLHLSELLALDNDTLVTCLKTCVSLLMNVHKDAYHSKVRRNNPRFHAEVACHGPALELLQLAGFAEESDDAGEAFFVFRGDAQTSASFSFILESLERVSCILKENPKMDHSLIVKELAKSKRQRIADLNEQQRDAACKPLSMVANYPPLELTAQPSQSEADPTPPNIDCSLHAERLCAVLQPTTNFRREETGMLTSSVLGTLASEAAMSSELAFLDSVNEVLPPSREDLITTPHEQKTILADPMSGEVASSCAKRLQIEVSSDKTSSALSAQRRLSSKSIAEESLMQPESPHGDCNRTSQSELILSDAYSQNDDLTCEHYFESSKECANLASSSRKRNETASMPFNRGACANSSVSLSLHSIGFKALAAIADIGSSASNAQLLRTFSNHSQEQINSSVMAPMPEMYSVDEGLNPVKDMEFVKSTHNSTLESSILATSDPYLLNGTYRPCDEKSYLEMGVPLSQIETKFNLCLSELAALDESTLTTCLKTCVTLLRHVLERPKDGRIRRICQKNARFQSEVGCHKPALELLRLAGFVEESDSDGEMILVFRRDAQESAGFKFVFESLARVWGIVNRFPKVDQSLPVGKFENSKRQRLTGLNELQRDTACKPLSMIVSHPPSEFAEEPAQLDADPTLPSTKEGSPAVSQLTSNVHSEKAGMVTPRLPALGSPVPTESTISLPSSPNNLTSGGCSEEGLNEKLEMNSSVITMDLTESKRQRAAELNKQGRGVACTRFSVISDRPNANLAADAASTNTDRSGQGERSLAVPQPTSHFRSKGTGIPASTLHGELLSELAILSSSREPMATADHRERQNVIASRTGEVANSCVTRLQKVSNIDVSGALVVKKRLASISIAEDNGLQYSSPPLARNMRAKLRKFQRELMFSDALSRNDPLIPQPIRHGAAPENNPHELRKPSGTFTQLVSTEPARSVAESSMQPCPQTVDVARHARTSPGTPTSQSSVLHFVVRAWLSNSSGDANQEVIRHRLATAAHLMLRKTCSQVSATDVSRRLRSRRDLIKQSLRRT